MVDCSPLVEEKLALEVQAMQRIHEAQDETHNELEQTLDRLAKTKIRNEHAHGKAGNERENMVQEIEDVKKELQDAVWVSAWGVRNVIVLEHTNIKLFY